MTGAVLTDKELLAVGESDTPIVVPFDANDVQPASIDLHLGTERYEYHVESYTLGDAIADERVSRHSVDGYVLPAGATAFVGLAASIHIPDSMIGLVLPRSSITRLGIIIQPVFMNPGYKGRMPLTVTNRSNFDVTLRSGVRVAQLVCYRTAASPTETYKTRDAKYYEEELSHSKLHEDRDLAEMIKSIFAEKAPAALR